MARGERSKAAYFLVDVSELPAEIKQDVLEDANAGGGEYGLRVVEIVHNGPAQSLIYGVYHTDADKWEEAKKELGITSTSVEDTEVGAAPNATPRDEASLRLVAEEAARAEADRIRTAEEAEITQITGDAAPGKTVTPKHKR